MVSISEKTEKDFTNKNKISSTVDKIVYYAMKKSFDLAIVQELLLSTE